MTGNADNYLDVVRVDHEDGRYSAKVTVRSDQERDVPATLGAEAAEAHIRAVADAFGWTITITDPGAVDSSGSGS